MKIFTSLALAAAFAASAFVLTTQYQEAPASFYGHFPASIGTLPVANGTWSFVSANNGPHTGIHSFPLTNVDCSGTTVRFATLTDISIYMRTNNGSSVWWIRDQNSGKVLWTSNLFQVVGSSTSCFIRDTQHFETPIVFSVGPLPPLVEVGEFGGPPFTFTPWPSALNEHVISALGRYSPPN